MPTFVTSRSSRTSLRALWLGAALAVPMFVPSTASADVACGDKTCSSGFVCNTYENYACPTTDVAPTPASGGATSSGDVDAAEQEKIAAEAEREKVAAPNCTPTVGYACVPAPCSVDADCGANMVCYGVTSSQCSGGAVKPTCAPDATDCSNDLRAEEPVCTTTTVKQCAYRWAVPCQVAADCGAGFTCEESVSCGCSGSSGSVGRGEPTSVGTAQADPDTALTTPSEPVASGAGTDSSTTATSGGATGIGTADVAEMPAEPSCSCTGTGTFYCKVETIACSADSDCPSGLTCVESGRLDCAVSSDGSSNCANVAPTKSCQPPYQRDLAGEAAYDSSVTTGKSETNAPTANGSVTGSTGSSGPVDTGESADEDAEEAANGPADVNGGGCSLVQDAPSGHGRLLLLALVGGLALLRRPRK